MLAHTDEALLVYDPENEGKPGYDLTAANTYAEQHPYPISLIDFDQLQETADEYFERQNQRSMKTRDSVFAFTFFCYNYYCIERNDD